MPDTTRTFIAVAVPELLAPRLRRLQQGLAGEVPEARWDMAMPFHVTLAFLGDVPHTDLNDVCKTVADAAVVFPRLELLLGAPGAFPDPVRPRVIWAGVGGPGLDGLCALQAAIAAAVARAGYRGDSQPFHPHVTLARIKTGKERGGGRGRQGSPAASHDLTAILQRRRHWKAGPFQVAEAITFSSTLTPDGPLYARLARAPLRGRSG
jgi:2'-5' RNA ligase